MTKPTPIEDRATRKIHNAAYDAARAKGACWDCAQRCGFAATDDPPQVAQLCKACEKKCGRSAK